MIERRLKADIHGSNGFTTIPRVVALVSMVGFLALGLHMGLQSIYAGRILPGVVVGGQNLGGKTLADARQILQAQADAYHLELKVQGRDFVLKASDIGVTFDPDATLNAAYSQGRWAWLLPLHTAPIAYSYSLDRHRVVDLASVIATEIGVAPVDADVVISGGSVMTVPERSGVTINKVGLVKLIERDVASPSGVANPLEPRKVTADIQAANLQPNIEEAKLLMATPIVLSYNDQNFKPTAADIGQWISFEKINQNTAPTLTTQVDAAQVRSYIQTVANKINISPVSKQVQIENGVAKVTREGVDGLAVDEEVLVAAITTTMTAHKPLTLAITTKVVPFKTQSTSVISLDYGQYIELSLSKQHLWVWQDHTVIFDSPVTTGAPRAGLGTVTGVFSIYAKQANTYLNGVGYHLHVNYWMPFYEGYGLHDAYWRTQLYNAGKISQPFGGQDYVYLGSHGCVNLPDATAAFIYNWASVGTPVWVHE